MNICYHRDNRDTYVVVLSRWGDFHYRTALMCMHACIHAFIYPWLDECMYAFN